MTVHERVAWLFATRLHIEVPSMETDLFDTGALDSLGFVELLVQLENEFGVRTSPEDLELKNFQSISSIADFVMARDGGGAC